MKLVIAALAVVAVAVALAAPPADKDVQILKNDFDQQPDGSYKVLVELDDGTKREETGEIKTVPDEENKPHDVVVVKGSYQYTNPDGQPETVQYYADETGFHADGPSIPKEPIRQ